MIFWFQHIPSTKIRTRKRSLVASPLTLKTVPIKKKMEPKFNTFQMPDSYDEELSSFNAMYSLWSILCNVNSNDQVVPPFSGFGVQDRLKHPVKEECEMTKLKYLPPIDAPITSFSTIYKLFEMLLLRAGKVNMPYVNLTFDAGAFVNAYRVLCNYPDKFSKIFLHLGDFHFMKEVFTILGTLVKGSGFEDVIFQAGVCSTGSLTGVLSGSHYNRCWTIQCHGRSIRKIVHGTFCK